MQPANCAGQILRIYFDKQNMSEPKKYTRAEIEAVMPQQAPFLFLDSAVIDGYTAYGTYKIKGDEDFLRGHFKNNPVFPGTIMLEAFGQLGVLYLLKASVPEIAGPVDSSKIFVTSLEMARVMRICRPGDVMEVKAEAVRLRHPIAAFRGHMEVAGERAAFVEKTCLTFDYLKI